MDQDQEQCKAEGLKAWNELAKEGESLCPYKIGDGKRKWWFDGFIGGRLQDLYKRIDEKYPKKEKIDG